MTTNPSTATQRSFSKETEDDNPNDDEVERESLTSKLLPFEQQQQHQLEYENEKPTRPNCSHCYTHYIPDWKKSFVALSCCLLVLSMGPEFALMMLLSGCLTIGIIFQVITQNTVQPTRAKALAFHCQKPLLLVAYYSGDVEIWNTTTNKRTIQFSASSEPIRACQFLPSTTDDTDWIVTAGDDCYIRIFQLLSTKEGPKIQKVHEWQGHDDYIRSLAVVPHSNSTPMILSGGNDHTVKLWDLPKEDTAITNSGSGTCTRIFEGHAHYVMMIRIVPGFNNKDHNTNTSTFNFATASLDGTIQFWNRNQDEALFVLQGHEKGVNCIAFLNANSSATPRPLLASGGDDHQVLVWNYQSRTVLHRLEGHTANLTAVLFHPCLPLLFSTSEDCAVHYWKFRDEEEDYPGGTCTTKEKRLHTLELQEHHPQDISGTSNNKGRGWALAGTFHKLAIGFDQGCVCVDLSLGEEDGNQLEVVNEKFLCRRI